MTTIYISAGAIQYVGGTVTEITGKDITLDLIDIGLSTSTLTPPTDWLTPDVKIQGATVADAVVKLLVSSTLPTTSPVVSGSHYYCWVRLHDTPEVTPQMFQGRIDIT